MKKNCFLSDSVQIPLHSGKTLTGFGRTAQPERHDEIERLRREVSRLTIERNMLQKTAVYFSQRL